MSFADLINKKNPDFQTVSILSPNLNVELHFLAFDPPLKV